MAKLSYDPKNQALVAFEEHDAEFETPLIRCEEATLVIVDDGVVEDYCGDPDDEDYDADDYPGMAALWDDFNTDKLSPETRQSIQTVPLREVIEFYIKNHKG